VNVPLTELSALPVAGIALYFMYRLSANHMDHLTAAIHRLADTMTDLKDWLQRDK
jgi:hypothetical protein